MIDAIFFDMDHTLIDLDCDVSWKKFLISKNMCDSSALEMVDMFFEQYLQGKLDYDHFIEFQLKEFIGKTVEEIEELSQEHFEVCVKGRIYTAGRNEVLKALQAGKPVSLLSATNTPVGKPLATALGIPNVIATEPEVLDGKYTGKITGTYCCGEGKIIKAEEFCEKHGCSLQNTKYYGDSYTDRFILNEVGYPVAVNPSELLEAEAIKKGWEILSFN
jgi:HAD superfamily hydrolase (TIGR01490 family)